MKISNNAFTLAEVLITLSIIGIVAALTIPALNNSINDNELKVAFKKTTSELSAATNSIIQDNGGSVKGTLATNSTNILNAYTPYLKTIKTCTNSRTEGCWHPLNTNGGTWENLDGTSTDSRAVGTGAILSNGAIINFVSQSANCSHSQYYSKSAVCAWILVDVNGFKPPNIEGKDVFHFFLLESKLDPWGSPDSTGHTCSGDGLFCTAAMLMQ